MKTKPRRESSLTENDAHCSIIYFNRKYCNKS